MTDARVLFVPGLRGEVPEHWQSIAQREIAGAACVPRITDEKRKLSCAEWVKALDSSIDSIDGPVILVAHSAGVLIVAQWATRFRRPIRAALLATPPDLETPLPQGYPTLDTLRENGWMPVPREPLPFPSVVAASRNDPLSQPGRVAAMARAWGSRLVDVGDVGHLNPAAGFGPWPRVHELIRELAAA